MKNLYGHFLFVLTLFFTFSFFSFHLLRFDLNAEHSKNSNEIVWKKKKKKQNQKKPKETLSECANIGSKNQNWKILCKNCAPKVLNSFLWFISRIKLVHKKLINQIKKKHYLQIFAENGVKTKECRSVQLRYTYVFIVHRHTVTQTPNIQPPQFHIAMPVQCSMCSPNVTWQTALNWWRIVMIHGKNIEETNRKMKGNRAESRLLHNEIRQKFFYFIEQTPLLTATFSFALQSHSHPLTMVTRIRVFNISMLRMMICSGNATTTKKKEKKNDEKAEGVKPKNKKIKWSKEKEKDPKCIQSGIGIYDFHSISIWIGGNVTPAPCTIHHTVLQMKTNILKRRKLCVWPVSNLHPCNGLFKMRGVNQTIDGNSQANWYDENWIRATEKRENHTSRPKLLCIIKCRHGNSLLACNQSFELLQLKNHASKQCNHS